MEAFPINSIFYIYMYNQKEKTKINASFSQNSVRTPFLMVGDPNMITSNISEYLNSSIS